MSNLPKMPVPDLKAITPPKQLQNTIAQMKKAKQDTKALESAHKQLEASSNKLATVMKTSQKVFDAEHGILEEVCKTPPSPGGPVPIPYPNILKSQKASDQQAEQISKAEAELVKATENVVKQLDKQAAVLKGKLKKSSGNEAGTLKGIISMTNMDKATVKSYSSGVKVQGKKCISHIQVGRQATDKQVEEIRKSGK